ncbi:MAG: gamma-glutamyltransferase [Gemmatimonadales bacterium]
MPTQRPARPASRRGGRAWALLALLLAGCQAGLFPSTWPYPRAVGPVTAEHGMVVTTDSIASQVGVDVLRAGGNAVDAAVAVQFALAVVNPEAGNIGGGGFMVVRLADGTAAALDFREKAPLAATRDMYLDPAGNATGGSLEGHSASGVPGSVAGMEAAHRRFGRLPWEELLAPAIRLASGFEVRERLASSLDASRVRLLSRYPASAAQFLPRGGRPPALGDTFRQPDLRAKLERIRDEGADGFYRGRTADLIVDEMRRGGGIITHADLASYDVAWRAPITFAYRRRTIVSMPPSSSGGATMAEIARILERWDLRALGWHSTASIHLYAEAWKRAYADRNQVLADPDFVDMPLERMTSAAYAAERAATISLDRATPASEISPGLTSQPREAANTTHFSIVDEEGNAVVVTTTLNSLYGNGVTVAGAGFLLNNEMDDFSVRPGTPNQFGLVQGERNAIEPGKRMLSAMTPTIVLAPDGSLEMLTGTPGGSTIITTVFQTISNVLDYGMDAVEAANAPRVHHQHLPDQIYYERGGLDPETVRELEAMGHTVVERNGTSGDVQLVLIRNGRITGWSDPRRGGRAIGY